jgi:hypothetical protein
MTIKHKIILEDRDINIIAPNEEYIGVVIRDEGVALSRTTTDWVLPPWHRIYLVEVFEDNEDES